MPVSAYRSHRGFTLLELLVVLALVGLVAAIALPNLERLYGAVTRRADRDHILDQLSGLGRRAMHQRRNFVIFDSASAEGSGFPDPDSDGGTAPSAVPSTPAGTQNRAAPFPADYEPYPIDVPEGWQIRLDPPLLIRANGVCLGAGLTLLYQGEAELRIELEPPFCRVEPDA